MGTVLQRRRYHPHVIRIDQTGCFVLLEFLPKMKSNQMDTISILTEVTGSGKFSTTIPRFFSNQIFIWLLSVPWKCLTTASHFKSDALNVCWMFWLHCSSSNFYLFYTQFVSYYPVLILIMLLNDDILDAYIWLKILYSTSLFPLSLSTARYRYI